MNLIKKMVCPNGCNAPFTTTAHIMQEWKVDAVGNFIEVTEECLQTTHAPDFDNIWSCTKCGGEGKLVVIDSSERKQPLSLDFNNGLIGFYECNIKIPDGYDVECGKVKISKADNERLFEKLKENYSQLLREQGKEIKDYDLTYEISATLCQNGPDVADHLQEGILWLQDGYLVEQEQENIHENDEVEK